MLDHLAYRCLVYDCHQEWDDLPLDWESDLTAAADVVFAASPGLRQRLLPCSDNIALLPNGANPQMFLRDGLEPPELVRQLPRPVFARVGDVSADLELAPLVHTAQRPPPVDLPFTGSCGPARSSGPVSPPQCDAGWAGARRRVARLPIRLSSAL